MFRLQRRAVAFTRIGDRGGEVPDVRSEHRPPNPFYPSGGHPRHRRHNVFKSLTCLGPAPKALRSPPLGCLGPSIPRRRSCAVWAGAMLNFAFTEF
jgi:hypothetical protein